MLAETGDATSAAVVTLARVIEREKSAAGQSQMDYAERASERSSTTRNGSRSATRLPTHDGTQIMPTTTDAIVAPCTPATSEPRMLTTKDVAKLLQCSDRHVTNLRKEGRMPPSVSTLGTLVRWPRQTIEDWVQAGCPTIEINT
jgi:excisionase family DNA binding protein